MKKENLKSAITCDLDGKVLSFSKGAENIFGYKSKDVVGKMRVSDFSDGEVVLGHVINWLDIAVKEGVLGKEIQLSLIKTEMRCLVISKLLQLVIKMGITTVI